VKEEGVNGEEMGNLLCTQPVAGSHESAVQNSRSSQSGAAETKTKTKTKNKKECRA